MDNMKFMGRGTVESKRAPLVNRQSDLGFAGVAIASITYQVNKCKAWQKVGESADIFPSLKYVGFRLEPSDPLESAGARREHGGENAERCIFEDSVVKY